MDKKIAALILIAAILIIAGLASGFYFYSQSVTKTETQNPIKTDQGANKENSQDQEKAIKEATKGVLPSIQTNALEKKPDLNPVDKTNPYQNIKTNPFQ